MRERVLCEIEFELVASRQARPSGLHDDPIAGAYRRWIMPRGPEQVRRAARGANTPAVRFRETGDPRILLNLAHR
jgi:hypothetical protein